MKWNVLYVDINSHQCCVPLLTSLTKDQARFWHVTNAQLANLILLRIQCLHFTKICCVFTFGEPFIALFVTWQLKFALWSFRVSCIVRMLLVVPNFFTGSMIFSPNNVSPFLVHVIAGMGLPPVVLQLNWTEWPSTSASKVVLSWITGLSGETETKSWLWYSSYKENICMDH